MNTHIITDSQILGGVPCFAGTRVSVHALFDHLEAGYTVDYFLTQFPTVRKEQVHAALASAKRRTEEEAAVTENR